MNVKSRIRVINFLFGRFLTIKVGPELQLVAADVFALDSDDLLASSDCSCNANNDKFTVNTNDFKRIS